MTLIIDRRRALTLGAGLAATGLLAGCATSASDGPADIVDTAVAAGSFTTLVAAIQAAGLVETLKGPGPFTVFAPTDAAFAALPEATLDDLLLPENRDTLTAILTYHVAPANYPAASLLGTRGAIPTVNGQPLHVDGRGEGVQVEGATVTTPDVFASNGVIHVIDTVLLP
ncbi:fasciclin domain-containing protein [Jannaschia seohaensis]|uniref:Putative surface protein with fasciclin (FAS1) repeats n=1 Tax=Jannaschia seohaensis TaxID=475081 RepID=A0A2Y9BVU4_9RHOB|nr:fasciclin domain-containing protein [Jannaschia seohaensis]PWJ21664.1 putative surface protein with fasciclin (FAS1) repeats [Jannaschia seohaensis]SSA37942.1 Uncaracterized surface protein containing fasciclin (FAS1) repeats [Jannaschia seohaensis]